MSTIHLFTIGFTKKTAEEFFTKLHDAGIKRLIDVRLNNTSQLAGFAKKEDLRYFLRAICGIDYLHLPALAPTEEILDAYKKQGKDWALYEDKFLRLMSERAVENALQKDLFDGDCLLCGEAKPDRCHRRLVAEYLRDKWGNMEIVHLV